MASRKQVQNKVEKLGGSLVVNYDHAYLNAPAGFTFDGYHYVSDNFDEGKQSAWDMFWDLLKQLKPCEFDNCCGKVAE